MQDTTYGDAQEIRAWVWQTCTEFGYYQSTDSDTAGPFFGGKPALPVQGHNQVLNTGSTSTNVAVSLGATTTQTQWRQPVANVNAYYGGRDHMDSSYIILPNGNIDPWHALGKLNSTTSTIIPVVIDGTAHCADMYATSLSDPASMTAARKTISTQLQQWLQAIN
ncbi:hypothetical protein OSTOST_16450 [Ostertagia ostertagi]